MEFGIVWHPFKKPNHTTMKKTLLFATLFALLWAFEACSHQKSRLNCPSYDGATRESSQDVLYESKQSPGLKKAESDQKYSPSGAIGDTDVSSNVTQHNTESYAYIEENRFLGTKEAPLSTFSIDVDNASYSNCRRMILAGNLPPADAVRIEEFINYFNYDYTLPTGKHPFSIHTEYADCPWNKEHKLVHIGLQGKRFPFESMAPLNLVFLLDVSGSMEDPNKLPLLKRSLEMLVAKLRPQDKVAIVVYAGASGLVLEPTNKREDIMNALGKLNAGGSTAGGQGIELAYATAQKYYNPQSNNRIILATDGDFNIGSSSDGEMIRLIETKRDMGIFMTVLGFGMGNYKDSKMEGIADHGNGNYYYIDNIEEAQKVLVDELDGTLYTIAKDVKLQVEFNPQKVAGYRLIGYENRRLNNEDFNDDKKDAGELGAGHTVTAIYEIIPAEVKNSPFLSSVDPLKYQTPAATTVPSDDILSVKFRYKEPLGTTSILLEQNLAARPVSFNESSETFRFAASVAAYGMLLRNSSFKGNLTYPQVLEWATASKGIDKEGYRGEFVKLIRTTQSLAGLAEK
jgi:Ca-activated chloride channel family protein